MACRPTTGFEFLELLRVVPVGESPELAQAPNSVDRDSASTLSFKECIVFIGFISPLG
jgi:hypothetical protein